MARAINQKAEQDGLKANEVEQFKALPGNGLTATYNGTVLSGGSYKFISKQFHVPSQIKEMSDQLSNEGKTPLFFACDKQLCCIIAWRIFSKKIALKLLKKCRIWAYMW